MEQNSETGWAGEDTHSLPTPSNVSTGTCICTENTKEKGGEKPAVELESVSADVVESPQEDNTSQTTLQFLDIGADDISLSQYDVCYFDTASQDSRSQSPFDFNNPIGNLPKENDTGKDVVGKGVDDDDDNHSVVSDTGDKVDTQTQALPNKVYYAIIDPILNHDGSCRERECIVYSYSRQQAPDSTPKDSDAPNWESLQEHSRLTSVRMVPTIDAFLETCPYDLAFYALKEHNYMCPCRSAKCLVNQHSIWPLSISLRHDFFTLTKTCPFSEEHSSLRPAPLRPIVPAPRPPGPPPPPSGWASKKGTRAPPPLPRRVTPGLPRPQAPPHPADPAPSFLSDSTFSLPSCPSSASSSRSASPAPPRRPAAANPPIVIEISSPRSTTPRLAQLPPMQFRKDFLLHNRAKLYKLLADADAAAANAKHASASEGDSPQTKIDTRDDLAALLHFLDLPRCLFSAEWIARGEMLAGERKFDGEGYVGLFCGNEVVVVRGQNGHGCPGDSRDLMAVVLTGKPAIVDNGMVMLLHGWRFVRGMKGQLERRVRKFEVALPGKGELVGLVEMDAFPLDMATKEVKEILARRGEKWWDMLRDEEGKGTYVALERDGWAMDGLNKYPAGERFMVDYGVYWRWDGKGGYEGGNHSAEDWMGKKWTGFRGVASSRGSTEIGGKEADEWPLTVPATQAVIAAEVAMLITPAVVAWRMTDRKWECLHVDNVRPVTFDLWAFPRLALPANIKKISEALIVGRAKGMGKQANKPLVVHFHGSPGTGKTATAKAVAELAELPLYHIRAADIPAQESSGNLREFFDTVRAVGSEWNCILLLDESDIWMSQIKFNDNRTDHSDVMDGFARLLETYPGVVIITSNRTFPFWLSQVGRTTGSSMDESIKSRIHVSLSFPALDRQTRRKVWNDQIDLRKDRDEMPETTWRLLGAENGPQEVLEGWAMNGHQINAAIDLAAQLAEVKGDGSVGIDGETLQMVCSAVGAVPPITAPNFL